MIAKRSGQASERRVAQKKDPALFTTIGRSDLMSRVRQKSTAAEKSVRRLVHSLGFRFRVNDKGLPGSPDLASRKFRWAVFVHGCYWHAHEGCKLWKVPADNQTYWLEKFEANRERDLRKLQELESLGYRVHVVWQCEIADQDVLSVRLLEFLEVPKEDEVSESYRFMAGRNRVARTITTGASATTTLQEIPAGPEIGDDPHSAFDYATLRGLPRVLPASNGRAVRVADLFCGCGGLSLGIREACWAIGRPFVAALAVDHDLGALEVYRENFSPLLSSGMDLENLLDRELGESPSARERQWAKDIGVIDILVAGPPCQGHSDLNNETRRSDPRNQLYEKVGRFVEVVRPLHVIIENVPGVVHDRKGALTRTTRHMENLGYHIATGIVDLSKLGVPQTRKRHVLLASLLVSVQIDSVLEKHGVAARSVEWAIRDLERRDTEGLLDTASRPSAENLERIRYLLQNDAYDLPNALRPICHQDEDHSYKSMYGRLSWTEPAQTITSGFGSPGQGRFIHPSQPRTLTPREAARLQFFPDSFAFSTVEKRTHLAQMIGNAVPMKLSWIFGLELLALDSAKTADDP